MVACGFSPSVAEMAPQTLSQGQAHLLNLVRDMVASLCSDSPESAYQSLVAQVQSLTLCHPTSSMRRWKTPLASTMMQAAAQAVTSSPDKAKAKH